MDAPFAGLLLEIPFICLHINKKNNNELNVVFLKRSYLS